MIDQFLASKLDLIKPLFEKYSVVDAFVFGSVCTSSFTDHSDVDFLIRFANNLNPLEKGENWWNLFYDLKNLLNRDIDLITTDSLSNPYFLKVINQTKTSVYGG